MAKKVFSILLVALFLLSIPITVCAEWLDEGTTTDRYVAYNYAPMRYHIVITWEDNTQRFIDYVQGDVIDIKSGSYIPYILSPDGKTRVTFTEYRSYKKLSNRPESPVKGATTLSSSVSGEGSASVSIIGFSADIVTISPDSSAPTIKYREVNGDAESDRLLWSYTASFNATDPYEPSNPEIRIERAFGIQRTTLGVYSGILSLYNEQFGTAFDACRVYNYQVRFDYPCLLKEGASFIIQQPTDGSALAVASRDLYQNLYWSPFTATDVQIDQTLGLVDATVVGGSGSNGFNFLDWLDSAFDFLDVELFGDFTIGGLLSVVLGISVLLAFLKIFAGG